MQSRKISNRVEKRNMAKNPTAFSTSTLGGWTSIFTGSSTAVDDFESRPLTSVAMAGMREGRTSTGKDGREGEMEPRGSIRAAVADLSKSGLNSLDKSIP